MYRTAKRKVGQDSLNRNEHIGLVCFVRIRFEDGELLTADFPKNVVHVPLCSRACEKYIRYK
jgi:hypothetical protein